MNGSMTKLETFVNLGYRKDPFAGVSFETSDMARVRRIITMAVESCAMVSVVGERGIGKSDAVKAALKKQKIQLVRVERLDSENLTIGDIRTALITDLSTEGIKRGGELSSRQLRRIVGEAVKNHKQKVVLIIEEAQRLHPNTLRSLKTLREMEWMGDRELMTIILVAQSDPMNRPGVSEVALRSDCVRMQGLSPAEAEGYVLATIGKHFEDDARAILSDLPQARNFLELQRLCVELLNLALADGRERVSAEDVRAIAANQGQPLPKSTPRRQQAPVTGADALKSVLGRRTGEAADDKKEAAAC